MSNFRYVKELSRALRPHCSSAPRDRQIRRASTPARAQNAIRPGKKTPELQEKCFLAWDRRDKVDWAGLLSALEGPVKQ
jgi:hypothetical protein